MRSETIDYVIEGRTGDVWITLSGPFTHDQIPTFREKIMSLIADGNRLFVIDLESVTSIDQGVIHLFLLLLNTLQSKSGTMTLIFKNEHVSKAFSHYRNIFTIYPDTELVRRHGIIALLQRQRRILGRKTGLRISRPVALVLFIVVCGWFISLLFIIHLQNRHISEQQKELHELSTWETTSRIELDKLRKRLKPLDDLGILRDTTSVP